MDAAYACSYSPLRRVSEVFHSISDRFQSLSQPVLPDACCGRIFGGIHSVLFVRAAIRFQPVEVDRFGSASVTHYHRFQEVRGLGSILYDCGYGPPEEIVRIWKEVEGCN
jgi:hypothetical protein